MVMIDREEYTHDETRGNSRDTFLRVRAPKLGRNRSHERKPASAPGGIRQRRNKHWVW